jgi:hypothetical protein
MTMPEELHVHATRIPGGGHGPGAGLAREADARAE